MRIKILIRLVISIILVSITVVTTGCAAYYDSKLDEITLESVQEFDISSNDRYMEMIERSKNIDIYLGEIESPEDLMEKGEALWIQIYGDMDIQSEKPYRIYYDSNADIWMMHGELGYEIRPIKRWIKTIREKHFNYVIFGGVAYIIVQGNDGKVLAIWHEF